MISKALNVIEDTITNCFKKTSEEPDIINQPVQDVPAPTDWEQVTGSKGWSLKTL